MKITFNKIKDLASGDFSRQEGIELVDHVEANLPQMGWVKLSRLLHTHSLRTGKKFSFYDSVVLLVEAGYFVRIVTRTKHRVADALVSRLGFIVDRDVSMDEVPRTKPDPFPQFGQRLTEFMDLSMNVGQEVEIGEIYPLFLVHLDKPDVPHQIVSRQLDKTRYRIRSTTLEGRRVRVVKRIA
jgi:hypothetical protein